MPPTAPISSAGEREQNRKRPNVLVIMSDDQGAWAMGCAGNSDVQTPNLDRLAASGMRFDNFFCASPVCSPARASFLTGRIPSQHGIHDWIKKGNAACPIGHARAQDRPIEYLQGLTAYTEILAHNGYICDLSGKWHLGASNKPQKSFTGWFAYAFGGGDYYGWEAIKDGALYTDQNYVTDVITDEALAFLEKRAPSAPGASDASDRSDGSDASDGSGAARASSDQPFYLSVHYTAPHSPWDRANHPADFYDYYADCEFLATPDLPLHPWQCDTAPMGVGRERRELLQGYYAAITIMDAQIGRLLDALESHGLRENTLIVFTSDNGMNMGHHGIWGKGNGTFPQNMYDTSVKVPFIVSRPGHVPEGRIERRLCSQYDFMPTLLEYLGIENPFLSPSAAAQAAAATADSGAAAAAGPIPTTSAHLPGVSFAPLLEGRPAPEREALVVFDEYGPVRMIRTHDCKYVHRYPYGPHEFYDLRRDPDEKHNLIDDANSQKTILRLRDQMENWFLRYVNPAMDGVRQPVTGKGQLDRVGVIPAEGKTFDTAVVMADPTRDFHFDHHWRGPEK
ncbi:MAG: sulfatase-like hydrolase/transferase [Candidatus Sumerlaeota bacterium]|nr:sulfatase-like hydrolase/transferase [Candidatus Sumerlaeota bacterium]